MRLIIDTREQLPLTFRSTERYDVVKEKLDFGDYGLEIDGKLVCSFERKSPMDLIGTLTKGHERFKHECDRAKEDGALFYISVECCYTDFINKAFEGSFRTKMKGYVLAKIVHTMQVKYNLIFLFFKDRPEMQSFIKGTFDAFIKEHDRKAKK